MSGAPARVRATFWLLEAPDSLIAQSHREPDGTGLGYFDADGRPHVDKRPLAAFEDRAFAREAREVFLIGHAGHPEVEGTMGQFDNRYGGRIHLIETLQQAVTVEVHSPDQVAYVTQTTLSVDDTASIVAALRARFPALRAPLKEDICYATQNRQDAVKGLIERCDVLLVVGSAASSNSNRLRELADRAGKPGHLIDGPQDLMREWFDGVSTVGVTAGASAPEILVQGVIERLMQWGGKLVDEVEGRAEHVMFSLPKVLRQVAKRSDSLSSVGLAG